MGSKNQKKISVKMQAPPAFLAVVFLLFFFVFSLVFLLEYSAKAAINQQINYQGKLLNDDGYAVSDGSYNFRFRICQNSDCSGVSDPLWTETHCYSPDSGTTCDGTGTDSRIAVSGGIFNSLLGSIASLSSVDFDQTLYLEVQIGGSATTPSWETLTPRKIIGSVPAAFNADKLDGLDSAESGTDAHIVKTDASGNLTASANLNIGDSLTLSQGASNQLDLASGDSLNLVSGNLMIGSTNVITSGRLFQAADGSTSTPAFSFADDTNTGIYRGGTDILRFSTAGADRITILSDGNVGIGTTLPGNKLTISGGVGIGTTSPSSLYLSTAAPDGGLIIEGNVGIGTTIPSTKLNIYGSYDPTAVALSTDSKNPSITNNKITTVFDGSTAINSEYRYVSGDHTETYLLNSTADWSKLVVYGRSNYFEKSSSGDVGSLYGNYNYIKNIGSGTVSVMVGNYVSSYNFAESAVTSTATTMYGNSIYAVSGSNAAGGAGNATTIYGERIYAYALAQGDGTSASASTIYGLYATALAVSSGTGVSTVTNTYDVYLPEINTSGTIANNYGLYIEDQIAGDDLNYNIYSAGSTGINYFGGNVGIGTTSPDYALDVVGYVNGSSGLCINGDCQTAWPGSLPSGTNGQTLYNSSGTWTVTSNLYHDGTNVGIGTTSPLARLDISLDSAFTSGTASSINWLSATSGAASTNATGLVIDFTNYTPNATGSTTYGIRLNDPANANGSVYGLYVQGGNWDYGIYSEDNVYFTATSYMGDTATYFNTSGQLIFPASDFVQFDTSSTRIYATTDTTENLMVTAAGHINLSPASNVGIGTTAPDSKLSVLSTAIQLKLAYDSSNYQTFSILSDGALNIAQDGEAASFALTNGNVGIGTTAPDKKIAVNGSFNFDEMVKTSNVDDSALNLKSNEMNVETTGFGRPFEIAEAEPEPEYVIAGDFNNDGYEDLAAANDDEDTVSIFINNGDGSSADKADYSTGDQPNSIAVGDFDNDGYADLAVTNYSSSTVSIFINDGDGTFATKVDYSTDYSPNNAVTADFDNDGYLDLALSNDYADVSIFINNGNGTFATKVDYALTNSVYSLAAGDVNNDGYPDLAAANYYSAGTNYVSVLINNGNGTFAAEVDYTAGDRPYSVDIGDLDRDGYADLAVANYYDDSFSVFINDGDGTFAAKVDYSTGEWPETVSLSDLDNDGYADVVIDSSAEDGVYVHFNDKDGTFSFSSKYKTGGYEVSLAVADLDNDGCPDLALGSSYQSSFGYVLVIFNNGNGAFSSKADYEVDSGSLLYGVQSVGIGDLNNDGYADTVAVNNDNSVASVFLNNGDGTLAAKTDYVTGSSPYAIEIKDLNNDGYLDLAVAVYANYVSVLINNGNGTFATKVDYSAGTSNLDIAAGDLNNDGYVDLAVVNYNSDTVSILTNDGDGTFASAVNYTTGDAPYAVAIDDFDKDGYADLAVANYGAGSYSVSILINDGDGTFAAKVDYSLGDRPSDIAAGDLNNDGYPDLAVSTTNSTGLDNVSILINDGDGTFAVEVDYAAFYNPSSISMGDFDKDGYLDLAVGNWWNGAISVLINRQDGTFGTDMNYVSDGGVTDIAIGDLDNDGYPDVVAGHDDAHNISVFINGAYGNRVQGDMILSGRLLALSTSQYSPGISFLDDVDTGLANTGDDRLNLLTGGDVRLTITADGNVGIGTTGPSALLTVYNGSSTGTYTTSGWVHSSDERLKTNIVGIDNPLEKIMLLNGVYFHWKNNPFSEKQIGLIAQDVAKVVPEVVVGNEQSGYGISYGNLTALLIEGIKEQTNYINLNSIKLANAQTAILRQSNDMQTRTIHSFQSQTEEISTDLQDPLIENNEFAGSYTGDGEFQQITLTLEDPLDLSDLETKGGYLQYEIYISDPDSIIDFNTELGNQMDTNELEWSKANHPYFTPGWNQVSLPIDEAILTGQVDWQTIAHFRTYFKFSQTNQIKIKNLSFKAYPKPVLSEEDYFAIDFDTYNLTDDQDQAKAVKIISAKADANQQAIEEWKDQYQQELLSLSQTVSNMNDFDTMILGLVNSHEERIAVLEGRVNNILVGENILSGSGYFSLDSEGNLVADGNIKVLGMEAGKIKTDEIEMNSGSSGKGILYAGNTEAVILTDFVDEQSKIYITVRGRSFGKTLSYEILEAERGFKVLIEEPAEGNIEFNWLVIK